MSNLLEKASILLTPTAYDDGKVLSVKPEDGTGDFDFTRNSSATRVNSQGLIEDVQILSSNLVSNGDFSQEGSEQITNGDFATDSDWGLGNGWSIGGGEAVALNSPSGQRIRQDNILQVGKIYKVTYEVKSISSGGFKAFVGAVALQAISNIGVYTETMTTPTINDDFFIRTLGTTSGSIDNVSVKEVGQDWTLGTGWSIGTNKAIATDAAFGAQLVDDTTLVANKKYKVTFDISDYVKGNVRVGVGNVFSSEVSSNGSFTFIITSSNTNAFKAQTRAGGSGTTLSITNISVIEITDDTNLPRIDYSPYSGAGTCGHWLFEPQSTNLIEYSEDLSQSSWIKQYAGAASTPSVTPNFAISPEGTQNASRVVFDLNGGTTSSDYAQLQENISGTVGNDYTSSVYLKSNNSNTYSVTFIPVSGSTTIVTVTPEWQRFSLSATLASANFRIRTRGSEGSSDVTDILIWGAQVEEQSFATSYIPTSGSTVTRLQDAAFGAGSSDLINSTEGTLYAEIAALANGGVGDRYISLGSGSDVTNTVQLLYHNTANRINFRVTKGGSFQVNISDFTFEQTENLKIAVKFKANDFALWINGVERVTDTSGQTFGVGTLQKLQFDSGNRASDFFGKTKCVAVFKEALTDAELTCLTTI